MTSFQLNQIRLRPGVRGPFFFIVLPANEQKKFHAMDRKGIPDQNKREKGIHGTGGGFAGEMINKQKLMRKGEGMAVAKCERNLECFGRHLGNFMNNNGKTASYG